MDCSSEPQRGLSPPPLPAWPAEAFEHEPAHGFFQRLALQNGQQSARVLAGSCGLDGYALDPAELLEFCLAFPTAHRQRLVDATPQVGDYVVLYGQTFQRHDWSISQPRVCPACLADKAYYRTWFDLTVLSHCPIHHLGLRDGAGGSKLAWLHPEVGVTPDGYSVVSLAAAEEAVADTVWEQYVLARMGVLPFPTAPMPLVDDAHLFEVIQMSSLLGCAALFGRRANRYRTSATFPRRAEALAVGFAVLRGGDGALDDLLRRYAGIDGHGRPEQLRFGFDQLYGWLSLGLRTLADNPLTPFVFEAMLRVAKQAGVYGRSGAKRIERGTGDILTLKDLANHVGLNQRIVRAVAVKLGLARTESDKSRCHSFSPEAVEAVAGVVADLVPRREAAALAGTSWAEFGELCDEGLIAPFIRIGGGSLGCERFRRSDIHTMICEAQVETSRRRWADERRQRIAQFRPKPRNLRPGLSFADAAAELGVELATVPALVRAGHLKVLAPPADRMRPRVEQKSVQAFAERFAVAKLYRGILGCAPSNAHRLLIARGLTPLAVEGSWDVLFKRADVRRVLGLASDPDLAGESAGGQFFRTLRRRLQAARSPTRLLRWGNGSCVLASGGMGNSARLSFCDECARIELRVDPKRSPRRFEAVERRVPGIATLWPGVEVLRDAVTGGYILRDQFQFGQVGAHEEGSQSAAFDWIESRMLAVRALLSSCRRGEFAVAQS